MEDKNLKKTLSTTKIKADKGLKNRVLHQIEAEKHLVSTKQKGGTKSWTSYLSILGVMYAFLLVLTSYFYIKTDGNLFQSTTYIVSALFLASVFSIYWFTVIYDDYKKSKNTN